MTAWVWCGGLARHMVATGYLETGCILHVCRFDKIFPKPMAEADGLGVCESSGELLISFVKAFLVYFSDIG